MFEDCSNSKITGVSDQAERSCAVGEEQDRAFGECIDEGRKGDLTRFVPEERDEFSSESKKRLGYLRVVVDKTTVKVAKAKE